LDLENIIEAAKALSEIELWVEITEDGEVVVNREE
jgi:hypothetical protein